MELIGTRKRQTGRTIRMLQCVLKEAQNPNLPENSVAFVVGHSYDDLDRLKTMLTNLAEKRNITIQWKDRITAQIGNATIRFTVPHRNAVMGCRPYAVHVDHACWDLEYVAPETSDMIARCADTIKPVEAPSK